MQALGFFKGMSFPIASIAVVNSVLFGVYSNALLLLTATAHHERRTQPPSYTHVFIAGCTGGFVQVHSAPATRAPPPQDASRHMRCMPLPHARPCHACCMHKPRTRHAYATATRMQQPRAPPHALTTATRSCPTRALHAAPGLPQPPELFALPDPVTFEASGLWGEGGSEG